jgi:type IV pilus biogenesis protein CpaD/CtpE
MEQSACGSGIGQNSVRAVLKQAEKRFEGDGTQHIRAASVAISGETSICGQSPVDAYRMNATEHVFSHVTRRS